MTKRHDRSTWRDMTYRHMLYAVLYTLRCTHGVVRPQTRTDRAVHPLTRWGFPDRTLLYIYQSSWSIRCRLPWPDPRPVDLLGSYYCISSSLNFLIKVSCSDLARSRSSSWLQVRIIHSGLSCSGYRCSKVLWCG